MTDKTGLIELHGTVYDHKYLQVTLLKVSLPIFAQNNSYLFFTKNPSFWADIPDSMILAIPFILHIKKLISTVKFLCMYKQNLTVLTVWYWNQKVQHH